MARQENGRGILYSPPLMRTKCLESALVLRAILYFDEGNQRAAPRDDVELACGGGISSRQDAPAREPEAQRTEPLRREATLVSRTSRL